MSCISEAETLAIELADTEAFDIELLEHANDIELSDGMIIYRDLEIPESYPDLVRFWMENGIE